MSKNPTLLIAAGEKGIRIYKRYTVSYTYLVNAATGESVTIVAMLSGIVYVPDLPGRQHMSAVLGFIKNTPFKEM